MKRIVAATLALGMFVGCTPDEEKVKKVIERALQECKEAEGDFAEITVVGDKDEVLKATCTKEITDLKLVDEYHASAMVGPYTYLVGIDSETGVWTLTQIDWEPIMDARKSIAGEDPPKDARQRAEKSFAQAQEEFPESAWIRQARFENLLELRKTERSKSDDPIALGDAQKVLDDTAKWASENDRKEVEAQLRLDLVSYYGNFADKLTMAFDNLGGSDEWLEASISAAEKEGNKEDAEKYRKELEEAQAKRPGIIKEMQDSIVGSRKAACAQLEKIDPNALEGELKTQAMAVKQNTDCSPAAFEPPDPSAMEEGGE